MSYARLALASAVPTRSGSRGSSNSYGAQALARTKGALARDAAASLSMQAAPSSLTADVSTGSAGSSSGGRAGDWQGDSRTSFHWEDFVTHRVETRAKLEVLSEAREQQKQADALTHQRLQQLDKRVEELRGLAEAQGVNRGGEWQSTDISAREGLERLGDQLRKCAEELHDGLSQLEQDLLQQGTMSERRHQEIRGIVKNGDRALADELLSKMSELNDKLGDNMADLEDELTVGLRSVANRVSTAQEELTVILARLHEGELLSSTEDVLQRKLDVAQAQHDDLARSVAESFVALRVELADCRVQAPGGALGASSETQEEQKRRLAAAEQELKSLRADLKSQQKTAKERQKASEEARQAIVADVESLRTICTETSGSEASLRRSLEEAVREATHLVSSSKNMASEVAAAQAESASLAAEVKEAQTERKRLTKSLKSLGSELRDAEGRAAASLAEGRMSLGGEAEVCKQEAQAVKEEGRGLEATLHHARELQASLEAERQSLPADLQRSAEATIQSSLEEFVGQATLRLSTSQEELASELVQEVKSTLASETAEMNAVLRKAHDALLEGPREAASSGGGAAAAEVQVESRQTPHSPHIRQEAGAESPAAKREVLAQPMSFSASPSSSAEQRRLAVEHPIPHDEASNKLQRRMDSLCEEVQAMVAELRQSTSLECQGLQQNVRSLTEGLQQFRDEAFERLVNLESATAVPSRDSASVRKVGAPEDVDARLEVLRSEMTSLQRSVSALTNDVLKAQGGADVACAELVKLQEVVGGITGSAGENALGDPVIAEERNRVREDILLELSKGQEELSGQFRALGEEVQAAMEDVRQECRSWVDGNLRKLEDLALRTKDRIGAVATEVRELQQEALEDGLIPLRSEVAELAASVTAELERLRIDFGGDGSGGPGPAPAAQDPLESARGGSPRLEKRVPGSPGQGNQGQKAASTPPSSMQLQRGGPISRYMQREMGAWQPPAPAVAVQPVGNRDAAVERSPPGSLSGPSPEREKRRQVVHQQIATPQSRPSPSQDRSFTRRSPEEGKVHTQVDAFYHMVTPSTWADKAPKASSQNQPSRGSMTGWPAMPNSRAMPLSAEDQPSSPGFASMSLSPVSSFAEPA